MNKHKKSNKHMTIMHKKNLNNDKIIKKVKILNCIYCDKIFVNLGDPVLKGAMIANVGNSEAAYPMLRFQLRKDGKPIKTSKLTF